MGKVVISEGILSKFLDLAEELYHEYEDIFEDADNAHLLRKYEHFLDYIEKLKNEYENQ